MDTIEAIRSRISANAFLRAERLTRAQIEDLVALASEAPSSFNIQHWRFVAVTTAERKALLRKAAFDQAKVEHAAVTFIILGDMRAHEDLASTLAPSVEAGIVPEPVAKTFVGMANQMYRDERSARDEAIRSASLAAMTLMLAARARGYASGPMIGFDPAAVSRSFDIPKRYVPVMLLPVGTAAEGNWPRKPRLSVGQILRFESGDQLAN
jgi:nitroreductase